MQNHTNRFKELDIFRGTAVISMIIFHIFFVLDFFKILENNMYSGILGFLALYAQLSFLSLVGISLAISKQNAVKKQLSNQKFIHKQLKRTLYILSCAAIVSISTYLFVGNQFVRFGILHFIGTSIIILSFLANFKYLNLILGFLSIFGADTIHNISSNIKLLYIFGVNTNAGATIDYFPIFPWIGVIFIGIFIGNSFYKNLKQPIKIPNLKICNFAIFLGKHSLLIYMIHVPIIILVVAVFAIFYNP